MEGRYISGKMLSNVISSLTIGQLVPSKEEGQRKMGVFSYFFPGLNAFFWESVTFHSQVFLLNALVLKRGTWKCLVCFFLSVSNVEIFYPFFLFHSLTHVILSFHMPGIILTLFYVESRLLSGLVLCVFLTWKISPFQCVLYKYKFSKGPDNGCTGALRMCKVVQFWKWVLRVKLL